MVATRSPGSNSMLSKRPAPVPLGHIAQMQVAVQHTHESHLLALPQVGLQAFEFAPGPTLERLPRGLVLRLQCLERPRIIQTRSLHLIGLTVFAIFPGPLGTLVKARLPAGPVAPIWDETSRPSRS